MMIHHFWDGSIYVKLIKDKSYHCIFWSSDEVEHEDNKIVTDDDLVSIDCVIATKDLPDILKYIESYKMNLL